MSAPVWNGEERVLLGYEKGRRKHRTQSNEYLETQASIKHKNFVHSIINKRIEEVIVLSEVFFCLKREGVLCTG